MPDVPARHLDESSAGRVLDAQTSFGRARDDAGTLLGMLGRSAPMRALFRTVQRLAPQARATLITGETGSGKTTLMAVVQRLGPCRGAAQIVLTGGDQSAERALLLEACRGSRDPVTCHAPEVGDLPPDRQAELVRALAATADLPPGDGLHVIAATSLDVADAMARGRLRADLYFRLAGVCFHVPPLSDRVDDIPDLAAALLRDACRRLRVPEKAWTGAALRVLAARAWPGHVRELRNVVTRAVMLADDDAIGPITVRAACGPDLAPPRPSHAAAIGARPAVSDEDRARVLAALSEARGNKSAAAARLGLSRQSFYRLLNRLGA